MPNYRSNVRPKRSADTWTRTHHQGGDGSFKKPRFDLRNPSALAPEAEDEEDEEDAFLAADELTRRGGPTKRNAVNIDGFESDSSNEAFDVRASANAKTKKAAEKASKDEEDNDMFADLEEDLAPDGDADEEGGKKKKAVKFADLDDVADLEEVQNSKSGGHVGSNLKLEGDEAPEDDGAESTSDDNSEVGDEERAGLEEGMDEELGAGSKKKHAPKLDAFNLKAEKEEGGFDESLNYVRKATDPDAVFDSWIQGTSKKDMRRAKEAQAKREKEQRQKSRADDALDTAEVMSTLIRNLKPGEASLGALARLAPRDKKKPKWQNKKRNSKHSAMDVDEAPAEVDKDEQQRLDAVEAITGASDILMERGIIDINDPRELLVRHYRRETGQDWADVDKQSSSDTVDIWEFRWVDGDGTVQGPEPTENMKRWADAGYFANGVEFRPAGTNEAWRANVTF